MKTEYHEMRREFTTVNCLKSTRYFSRPYKRYHAPQQLNVRGLRLCITGAYHILTALIVGHRLPLWHHQLHIYLSWIVEGRLPSTLCHRHRGIYYRDNHRKIFAQWYPHLSMTKPHPYEKDILIRNTENDQSKMCYVTRRSCISS